MISTDLVVCAWGGWFQVVAVDMEFHGGECDGETTSMVHEDSGE